jgi:hypothetical protein
METIITQPKPNASTMTRQITNAVSKDILLAVAGASS